MCTWLILGGRTLPTVLVEKHSLLISALRSAYQGLLAKSDGQLSWHMPFCCEEVMQRTGQEHITDYIQGCIC